MAERSPPPATELEPLIHPLSTLNPKASTDDLTAITDHIGDADVIGLGEASHGTAEFTRFNHRLIRHLVDEHDVRLIALETNFAATLALNRFVHTGTPTLRTILSHPDFPPTTATTELNSFLQWVRSFNRNRPQSDRIAIHGLDCQHTAAAIEELRTFFETVHPQTIDQLDTVMDTLQDGGLPDVTDEDALDTHLDARATLVDHLEAHITENADTYRDRTSASRVARIERIVWMLDRGRAQFQRIRDGRAQTGANIRVRDSAMAAQVQWLRDHQNVDRMVVWAHNAHLDRTRFSGAGRHTQRIPSLGRNLAGLTTLEYYALALETGGGSSLVVGEDGTLTTEAFGPPPAGTLPSIFGDLNPPRFFLDLTTIQEQSRIQRWFRTEPAHYDISGGGESPASLVPIDPTRAFDGLVFIRETTPTTPIAQPT